MFQLQIKSCNDKGRARLHICERARVRSTACVCGAACIIAAVLVTQRWATTQSLARTEQSGLLYEHIASYPPALEPLLKGANRLCKQA